MYILQSYTKHNICETNSYDYYETAFETLYLYHNLIVGYYSSLKDEQFEIITKDCSFSVYHQGVEVQSWRILKYEDKNGICK